MFVIKTMIPVILLMAIGGVFFKKKILSEDADANLISLVWNLAIPAVMFLALLEGNVSKIFNIKFFIAYILTILIPFTFTFFVFQIWRKNYNLTKKTMAGLNASVSNSSLVAMPILLGIYGNKAVLPIISILIISMLVIIPISVFIFEYQRHDEKIPKLKIFRSALIKTVTQVFFIVSVTAILMHYWSLPFPKMGLVFLQSIANIMIPCALIAIGVGLSKTKISTFKKEAWLITFINLVFKPTVAIVVALLLHLPALYAISLVVVSTAPTANTVFALALKYDSYRQETAAIIFLTSIAFIALLPFFLWIATHYWPLIN